MKNELAACVHKTVDITLHATMPVTLEGRLLAVDDIGIVLGQPKGRSFIPFTSLLHVSLIA